jgi:hypothetical protein
MSLQINSKLDAFSKFNTWFLRADKEIIAEFAPRFKALYMEMENKGIEKDCNQVVASQIAFTVITS